MKTFTDETLKKSPYYEKIKYFVTNHDLTQIFANCKIVKYADLENYESIYDLLPNKLDFCFILTESEKNSGHWVCLMRSNKTFSYFDSYADKPKSILDFIPKAMNAFLGNSWNKDLGKMIKSIKKTDKFEYNTTPLQQELTDVNTCGRWVIARVSLFLTHSFTNKQFVSFIKKQQTQVKRPLDEVICMVA